VALISFTRPEHEQGIGGDVVSERVLTAPSQEYEVHEVLRSLVNEYRQTYAIRSRARDIVFRVWPTPPKDKRNQALAIARWVQQNIRYVEEMPEVFQTPTHTLATGYGDCEDFACLIASLCESIGIPTELVAMKFRGEYRHIFPRAVLPGGQRLPLDATLSAPIDNLTDPLRIARDAGERVTTCIG
jgi:transglutaminase-like putative cysteine protease